MKTLAMDKLIYIRQKCIEANPKIKDRFCCKYSTVVPEDFCDHCLVDPPKIRLADVLLAIENAGMVRGFVGEKKNVYITPRMTMDAAKTIVAQPYGWQPEYTLSEPCRRIILSWNLLHDDLTLQSEPTQTFIAELLGWKEK